MAHDQPILELRDETPDRPFLKLAGETYHFKLQSDLTMEEIAHVSATGRKFAKLGEVDELTPELAKEMGSALEASVPLVMLDMPAEVAATLSEGERIAIIGAFTSALSAGASPAVPSVTTQPESPASTASTPSGT